MADTTQNPSFEQVSGIFHYRGELDHLLDFLRERGIATDQVSVVMTEQTREQVNRHHGLEKEDEEEEGNRLPEGLATGAVSGGLLGGIIGGLTLVGSLLIPGVGVLAVGPIVGALAGGAIGSATGGLIGALVGAGIPEHEARHYEKALQEEGNILVTVHVPHGETEAVRQRFSQYGGQQVEVRS